MQFDTEYFKPIKIFLGIATIFLAFGASSFVIKGCSEYKQTNIENYEDLGIITFKPSSTRVSTRTITKVIRDSGHSYKHPNPNINPNINQNPGFNVSINLNPDSNSNLNPNQNLNPNVQTRTETRYILEYTDTETGKFTWERFYNNEWEAEKYLKSGIEVERRVIILKKGSRPYVTVDPDETAETYMNHDRRMNQLVIILGSIYLIFFASFIIFVIFKKVGKSKHNRQDFFNKTVVSGNEVWKDQDNNR